MPDSEKVSHESSNKEAAAPGAGASRPEAAAGGLTSISPPAKVIPSGEGPVWVLSSGIDSLVLALDVRWSPSPFFGELEYAKQIGKHGGEPRCIAVKLDDGDTFPFEVLPHGRRGYAWIMQGAGFEFRIADQLKPGSRPGVMVEFRSDLLWRGGPKRAVEDALAILAVHEGDAEAVRVSRVDFCVDLLVPESLWGPRLLDFAVCRATARQMHWSGNALTGLTLGRGTVLCRLYDKDLEIRTKSGKDWMRFIWRLPECPAGSRIIRVEFQVRREAGKQLGLDTIEDLWERAPEVWRYLTEDWLKFQTNPGEHHTMRKTLPWWEVVQAGFAGAQGVTPAVRAKANKALQRRLVAQMYGLGMTVAALGEHGRLVQAGQDVAAEDLAALWHDLLLEFALEEPSLANRLRNRIAKRRRLDEKHREALRRRELKRQAKRKLEGGDDA